MNGTELIATGPLVSVLMVTYNHEAFIGDAIQSVLNSSYPHFELIVVDDLSKDGTYQKARAFAEKDNRVRVYKNEINLGDYPNRNKAASYATGVYLKYLDGDDMIYPDSLKIMVSAMEAYPEAALGLQQFLFDDVKPYPLLATNSWALRTHFLERNVLGSGPSGAIIKHSEFLKIGGFSGEKFVGDSELWIRMMYHSPLVLLQPSLVWWRIHPAQESGNEAKDKRMILVRYRLYKRFLLDAALPLSQAEKSLAIKKLNRRFIGNVAGKIRRGERLNYCFQLLKESSLSVKEIIQAVFH